MNSGDTVLAETEAGVRVLTLNRPDRRNGWTLEMERAYFDHLVGAGADRAVRAIVVTGAGSSFCPGVDAEVLGVASEGDPPFVAGRLPFTLPTTIPKPIVCAINGGCAGVGLVTALMCDVRFAARSARLATAFVRRGLPAEQAVSWVLPRITGIAVALDLLLSGRTVSADEAKELGLVNFVCEPADLLSAAVAYATQLAQQCSPTAMGMAKRQVYADLERTLEDARLTAVSAVAVAKSQADFREGVRSWCERRPPAFDPLAQRTAAEALLF